jgi:hypothetical protein
MTPRRFSASLKSSRKTNNHAAARPAKAEIRQNVLDAVGADTAAVFDAFAGEGVLYREVWSKAGSYLGCDLTWYRDARLCYVADSRRVMRAIDLAPFNVFDFDAWGSPWEHVAILCARRPAAPGEQLGIVITEGSGLKLKMGGLPHALAYLAGLNPDLPGMSRSIDLVIERAITETARRLRCRIVRRWQAKGRTGAAMLYVGLVLEGLPPAETKKAAEGEPAAA